MDAADQAYLYEFTSSNPDINRLLNKETACEAINGNESVDYFIEINQIMMAFIHKLCDRKQRQHLLDYFDNKNNTHMNGNNSSPNHLDLFRFIMKGRVATTSNDRRLANKNSYSVYQNLSSFAKPTIRTNLKRSGSLDESMGYSWWSPNHHNCPQKSINRDTKYNSSNKLTNLLFSNNSIIKKSNGDRSRKPSNLLNFIANDLFTSNSIRKYIFSKIAGGHQCQAAIMPPMSNIEDSAAAKVNGFRFKRFKCSQDVRQFWRKVISEQIILSKMEKEHRKMNIKASYLRERQEDGCFVNGESAARLSSLDYVEITPCLKEVDKIWTQWLLTGQSASIQVNLDEIR